MKKCLATVSAALLGLSVSGTATANYSNWMEQSLVAVCKASISNRPVHFSRTLKTYRIEGKRVLPNLVCNGEDVQSFAMTHGANRTADYIGERYLPGQVSIQDLAANQKIEVWFD